MKTKKKKEKRQDIYFTYQMEHTFPMQDGIIEFWYGFDVNPKITCCLTHFGFGLTIVETICFSFFPSVPKCRSSIQNAYRKVVCFIFNWTRIKATRSQIDAKRKVNKEMLKLWVPNLNGAKQNWVFSFNDYFPFFGFFWTFTQFAAIVIGCSFCVPCMCVRLFLTFSFISCSSFFYLLSLVPGCLCVHIWNGSIKLSCNLYPSKWFLLVFNSGSVIWKLKLVVGRTVEWPNCRRLWYTQSEMDWKLWDTGWRCNQNVYVFFSRLSTGPFDTKLFNRKINEPYRHPKTMFKKKKKRKKN